MANLKATLFACIRWKPVLIPLFFPVSPIAIIIGYIKKNTTPKKSKRPGEDYMLIRHKQNAQGQTQQASWFHTLNFAIIFCICKRLCKYFFLYWVELLHCWQTIAFGYRAVYIIPVGVLLVNNPHTFFYTSRFKQAHTDSFVYL